MVLNNHREMLCAYNWFEFQERDFSSSFKFGGECLWKLSFQPGFLGICSCGVCCYCSYALRLKEGVALEDKTLTNHNNLENS